MIRHRQETMVRQQYYLVEWPESKKYMHKHGCIHSAGMSYFVPCEIIDNEKSCK